MSDKIDLNITLEEENLENIIKELSVGNEAVHVKEEEEVMDTHGNVLLKYECDNCKKRVMTARELK